MCQYCGPNNHGRSLEKNGNHIGISRARVSSLLFWYNDTFACEFSWKIAYLCSSPHMMDVPCRALHEDIKRLCEKQSKTRRKYNKKLCHQRSSRNLYKIPTRIYFHKAKGVGWQRIPFHVLWNAWRNWKYTNNECRPSRHVSFILLQNVELMDPWWL